MRTILATAVGLLLWPAIAASSDLSNPLCQHLKAFGESVRPGDLRQVTFHTMWGGNFKTDAAPALYAKQCDHGDFGPAMAVCNELMMRGAVEFADTNVKETLRCLTGDVIFGSHVQIEHGAFSLTYGTSNRGSNIAVTFENDPHLGGMALRIEARGY